MKPLVVLPLLAALFAPQIAEAQTPASLYEAARKEGLVTW